MLSALTRIGMGAGLLLVFVGGSLLSLVLYGNLPAGRRVLSLGLQRVLSSTFEGSFAIDAIERVSLNELRARGFKVHDPDGHLVLSVDSVTVQMDLPGTVEKLLLGTGLVTLRFNHARIERAEVYLLPGTDNVPTIVEAFTPTPSAPGSASTSPSTQTLKIWFPEVEVGHIYGRMALDGAPTLETELSTVRGSVIGTADLTSVDVERFSATVRGLGGADATGVGSVHVRAPGAVWTSFDGYFGELQFGTVVRVDSPKLDIVLDVPRAEPKTVRALWAGYPLLENLSAHVEAVGTLQTLHTQAKVLVAQGSLASSGELRFGGHPGADLDLSARSLDLRALWPSAPYTSLDADAQLAVFQSGDQWLANVSGTTRATQILGTPLPPIDVSGSYDDKGFVGHAIAHEPGIPLKATFDVHTDGSIDGSVEAKGVDLNRAPRLQPYFDGHGLLDLQLKGRIDKGRLVTQVSGALNAFRYGQVSIDSNQFSGRASGPLADPQKISVDLSVKSQRLRAGALGFDELKTELRGPVTRPVVSTDIRNKHGSQISAQATITPSRATHIAGLRVEVRRDQAALTATAAELDVSGERVRVDGLRMEGAGGTLEASGQLEPDRLALVAHGTQLDLGVIAHAFGLPRRLIAGKASVDADLESTKKSQRGSFAVQLENGESEGVAIDSLSLSGQLSGSELNLQSAAKLHDFGSFTGDARATLSGSLAEVGTYQGATGVLTLKAEHVPFSMLSYLLPKSAGIEEVRGEGNATLVLDRATPEATPNLSLVANTAGLHVGLTARDEHQQPIAFDGVEAHAGLNSNGTNGDTDLVLKLDDVHGPLASMTARTQLDLSAALKHPEELLSQLRSKPLVAKVLVENRALEDLPGPLSPRGISGRLRTELSLRGSLDHPIISDKTELYRLRFGASERHRAVDVCAQVDYDKSSGQYGARGEVFLPKERDDARACQGGRVAQFSAGGRAEWDKLVHPTLSADAAWTGTAGLQLEGMPVDIVPAFADAGFGGRVLGAVMFDRREALPQVRAQLEVHDAVLTRTRLGTAQLHAHTDGRALSASLGIEQPDSLTAGGSQIGGQLQAELLTAIDWQGVVPSIDDTRPISASLTTSNLDAALLSPFVQDVLSEIGGKLDTALRLTMTPNLTAQGGEHWTSNVTGTLAVRDGTLQISQLGLRLRQVQLQAQAEAKQTGTVLRVTSLSAAAEGNRPNVAAQGWLQFSGSRIESGAASASLQGVPFLIEGVPLATLYGPAVTIQLERRPKEMFVRLTVPTPAEDKNNRESVQNEFFEAKLPQEASRTLIDLGNSDDIVIAQPISKPSSVSSGESLPWRMRFELGKNVKLTRADLVLPVSGSPEVILGESLQIEGNVDLKPGGRLSLPGVPRPFTIESGVVSFDADGDPKDPRLKVRAVCKLPQLTVWATVTGTFEDARFAFESDNPGLTNQAQILAALLGPSDNSSTAASNAGQGTNQLRAGAGYLSQKLLANTALSHLELNAGTETTADQRSYATYSAAYPLGDNFWFEGSYKTLQTQDLTGSRNVFSGTFDWRFKKNWSLTVEAGTIGAGTDLLWLYRY
ncbi:MAG TPA: hypothetical protein VER11_06945 [Polyangiaceae bacterium]|nr:hypothetical protein [Polyangiaceae bacterium]